MNRNLFQLLLIALPLLTFSQGDNEIQVYASPTIGAKQTIVELHNNYTFKGSDYLTNPKDARWFNSTLEVTHGVAKDFEIGFYAFTALAPDGSYQYLGNQIRPRITVPEKWKLPIGISLSVEFGRYRDNVATPYYWVGEIRPIFDKTIGNIYISINPNIDFDLSGPVTAWGFAPQAKIYYDIKGKVGLGAEYYAGLGNFNNLSPTNMQEHLIGPVFDLLAFPKWELQTGYFFGLTPNSNQSIIKVLLGRRFGS